MTKLILLIALAATTVTWASEPVKGSIPLSRPFISGWLSAQSSWPALMSQDTVSADTIIVDIGHPDYRYPGRAMLMSLLIPGSGQLYIRQPLKGLAFLAGDVAAYFLWSSFNERGNQLEVDYQAFADTTWDLIRWIETGPNFQGAGWEEIRIGYSGAGDTHGLEYFLKDMDGDGRPDYFGRTNDENDSLEIFIKIGLKDQIVVRKDQEYYENIGKYNQFFSGWSDADPLNPDIRDTRSGPVAWSTYRDSYLEKRGEANRLKSIAGYAVSAALFNHMISGVDALFASSAWNRKRAIKISGRLMYGRNAFQTFNVRGVEVSLNW